MVMHQMGGRSFGPVPYLAEGSRMKPPSLGNRLLIASAAALAVLASPSAAFAQEGAAAPPAGGAAMAEIVIASVGAIGLTTVLLTLGLGHRSGRVGLLGRVAAHAERLTGVPGWTALPATIATVSLVVAVFGMYWDISLHIDVGRDTGPLANPAHYFILAGLFGIFSAGFVAMVLPLARPGPTAIRITRDWYAPLGGVLICACGAFSLLGFPLDDVWHRLFGQDVTLWGPTHLMLIGGAAMTLIGIAVLLVEGQRASEGGGRTARERGWVRWARLVALTGGFLIGLSTFQAEFDFGVPQFRLVFQPVLIMLAAGAALVAARLWLGRGAAVGAVAFFILIRGLLALLVGPVLGETTPHLPLYLAEALIVEAVALRVPRERALAFGAWCGALIGTVGLAAEWGWSHVWMPIPWPAELLPEAALLGFAAALGGSLIGAWVGARLGTEPLPRSRPLRLAGAAGAAGITAIVAFALHTPADSGMAARVSLDEVQGGPERKVMATVEMDPAGSASEAEWLTATAWQGGGLQVDALDEVGPGVYRTTEPLPVHGNWKSMIRLHEGNSLTGVPVFLPEDPAIPAEEVPAPAEFTREFVSDHSLLQREQRQAPAGIGLVAYGVVLGITLALLGLLAWGIHRLSAAGLDRGTSAAGGRAARSAPLSQPHPPAGSAASAAG
jgi:hypothetical protein